MTSLTKKAYLQERQHLEKRAGFLPNLQNLLRQAKSFGAPVPSSALDATTALNAVNTNNLGAVDPQALAQNSALQRMALRRYSQLDQLTGGRLPMASGTINAAVRDYDTLKKVGPAVADFGQALANRANVMDPLLQTGASLGVLRRPPTPASVAGEAIGPGDTYYQPMAKNVFKKVTLPQLTPQVANTTAVPQVSNQELLNKGMQVRTNLQALKDIYDRRVTLPIYNMTNTIPRFHQNVQEINKDPGRAFFGVQTPFDMFTALGGGLLGF